MTSPGLCVADDGPSEGRPGHRRDALLRSEPVGPPYLAYHVVDANGNLVLSKEVEIPGPSMMHDFAIKERHVVFLDLPVVYDLGLLSQQPFAAKWKPEYGARVGAMPRDASAPPRWFEVEPSRVPHGQRLRRRRFGGARRRAARGDVHRGPLRHRRRRWNARPLDVWTSSPRSSERSGSTIACRSSLASTNGSVVVRIGTGTGASFGNYTDPFGTLMQHDLKEGTTTAATLPPGKGRRRHLRPRERDRCRKRGTAALRRSTTWSRTGAIS